MVSQNEILIDTKTSVESIVYRDNVRARCHPSSVSESSSKWFNSEASSSMSESSSIQENNVVDMSKHVNNIRFHNSDKKAKKKKKQLDTSRLAFYCQNTYNSDDFNVYLHSKNSNAIRDIVVKQQQYQLFYDNLQYIFTNFKLDFKYIFENVSIDITKLESNLNLEMVSYLGSSDFGFKKISFKNGILDLFIYSLAHLDIFNLLSDKSINVCLPLKDQINSLWVHSCGLNLIEPLRIMIRKKLTYNFERQYLSTYEHNDTKAEPVFYKSNFLKSLNKSTLLIQIIDEYPAFFNQQILDFLIIENKFKLDNAFNIDFMVYNSSNFELFNYFQKWTNDTVIDSNNIQLIVKIVNSGNYDYCKSLLNFSVDSDVFKQTLNLLLKHNFTANSTIKHSFYNREYVYNSTEGSVVRGITGDWLNPNFRHTYSIKSIEYHPAFITIVAKYPFKIQELTNISIMQKFICVLYEDSKFKFNDEDVLTSRVNNLEILKKWFGLRNIDIYKFQNMALDDFVNFIKDYPKLHFMSNIIDIKSFYDLFKSYISILEDNLPIIGTDVLNIIMNYSC